MPIMKRPFNLAMSKLLIVRMSGQFLKHYDDVSSTPEE
jgi:hypothetical protein